MLVIMAMIELSVPNPREHKTLHPVALSSSSLISLRRVSIRVDIWGVTPPKLLDTTGNSDDQIDIIYAPIRTLMR
jgi:hypothetical protein